MGFRGRGGGYRHTGNSRGRGRGRGYGRYSRGGGKLGKPSWGEGQNAGGNDDAEKKSISRPDDGVSERRKGMDARDAEAGVEVLEPGGAPRLGWLYNMISTNVLDPISDKVIQATDLFFIGSDGKDFRATVVMRPYFYLSSDDDRLAELETSVLKTYPELVACCTVADLEDLDAPNHLTKTSGRPYLKVECWTMRELNQLKDELDPYLRKNRANKGKIGVADAASLEMRAGLDLLNDIREHDVSPINRMAIDMNIRAGHWYRVDPSGMSGSDTDVLDEHGDAEKKAEYRSASLERVAEILERAHPVVLAFDIECVKQPLRFPDADEGDQVMMISWMIDGAGFLGINREIVSMDIGPFTYTPKPEFPGDFKIFNEPDEKSLLQKFFSEFRRHQPRVVVTYNGDSFDLPYIEKRAEANGLSMFFETGFRVQGGNTNQQAEYRARAAVHMDCLYWVNRDSYLPQGSRGLKAVTKALLGYDPLELDPEEMTPAARGKPQLLASYSVSDAVCTYYLYMKYVHPFVFSLCNILPLNPDDVLRKGSGTLCELLLMSEARQKRIIAPNKHQNTGVTYTPDGHILENETYIGGHVEALQSGVFRSDIPMKFVIDPSAIEDVEGKIDKILEFAITVEGKMSMDSVTNYDEIRSEILGQLHDLKMNTQRTENPLIYHLDVAAMYPNIILTNRLQPHAIVDSKTCAACDFNGTSDCQRFMSWTWRGEHYTASRGEVEMLKRAGNGPIEEDVTDSAFVKRLREYSRKNYRKITDTRVQERVATVCQRENSFYVDTVRAFRDRRYDYKQLLKRWKKRLREAESSGSASDIPECKSMIILYDSMQLAHKCILNSFYGYVMRRGARWFSMEMAGVVTQTGANIIRRVRQFIEKIGVPLELDTDGIWCTLPRSFPENFTFKTGDGRSHTISFICSTFNQDVSENFSNDQYQFLKDRENREYETARECSIFFEVDGPYRAMILPASKEENKQIKKRYAVFNDSGQLVELKGFELKRRGELKLVKIFQSELFDKFLNGSTLPECYEAVGEVANRYLDVLEQEGSMYDDESLLDLLVEQNNMSRSLADYLSEGQKSSAITTAKRLAELLGEQMVRDKVTCKYIICRKPEGVQVTERAIPVQVFSTEPRIRKAFLRRWTKESDDVELELRSLIDWNYYAGRLVSSIQKIISIPAALQQVDNPVPRIGLPVWLEKKVIEMQDSRRQQTLGSFLVSKTSEQNRKDMKDSAAKLRHCDDMEDITSHFKSMASSNARKTARVSRVIQPEEVFDESIEIGDGYLPWLKNMRIKWRKERKERQLKRAKVRRNGMESENDLDEVSEVSRRRRVSGISNYFLHDNNRPGISLSNSIWQILSIEEGDRAGKFSAWVCPLSEKYDNGVGQFVEVALKCSRALYVNSRVPKKEQFGKCVQAVLPRGRKAYNLHQVAVDAVEFECNPSRTLEQICDSEIEGLYESKIPILFDSITRVGSMSRPRNFGKSDEDKVMKEGIRLDQLENVGSSKRGLYLSDDVNLHYAHLYNADAVDESGRSIIALFFPPLRLCLAVFVMSSKQTGVFDCCKIYESLSRENETSSPDFNFEIEHVRTLADAGRAVNRRLLAIRESAQFCGRTVLCLQSSRKKRELQASISQLSNFPTVPFVLGLKDRGFQPLQWEADSFKTAVKQHFQYSAELQRKKSLARFADLPLGNLDQSDPYLQVYDAMFSRELRSKNYVLWASESEKPDLGGHEEEENTYMEEDRMNPEFTTPGAFRSVCVETEFMDLAAGSILASSQIDEIEGSELAFSLSEKEADQAEADSSPAGNPISDIAGSLGSFKILRDLLRRFEKAADSQKESDDKELAQVMQEHFYRWLRSESSLSYDPSLHCFVHGIMKKIFRLMLAELKNLGVTVVYASVSKIILATSKDSAFDGLRYAAFIESTLREKPVFSKIRFAPLLGVYSSLLFMDPHNYIGVPAAEEHSILEGKVQVLNSTSRVYPTMELPPSRMNWEVVEYLPKTISSLWMQIVDAFVRQPLMEYSLRTETEDAPDDKDAMQAREVRNFLSKASSQIFERVHEVQEISPALEIPETIALQRKLQSPALEFVNALMHVLSLDKRVEGEVANLRRSLLKVLGVQEFSSSAIFRSPLSTFRLPDVICGQCKLVVDLDVTKPAATGDLENPWICTYCEHPYDRQEIEFLLLREVQTSLTSYYVQDLRCVKCKMIKQDNLQATCSCSGSYEMTFNSGDLLRRLTTLRSVSHRFNLSLLENVTTDCMKLGEVTKAN